MDGRRDWLGYGAAIVAAIAWGSANGLDVWTLYVVLERGGQLAIARHHPAAILIIYAGMRLLGTFAIYLTVLLAGRLWPSSSKAAWSALVGCSLVTAALACWRLYR
jgi:drug/metabolite transporter (DMT)-like permease